MNETTYFKYRLLMVLMVLSVAISAWAEETKWNVSEGETFTSGQTLVLSEISLTFSETGGPGFQNPIQDPLDEWAYYTPGNGNNGNAAGGTFYVFKPNRNGRIKIGVRQNASKKFYVEENGSVMPDCNGLTTTLPACYYEFNVKGGNTYKVYAYGSKLGLYGFTFSYGQWTEQLTNGSMRSSDVSCFSGGYWQDGVFHSVGSIVNGSGYNGTRGFRVQAKNIAGNHWDSQFFVQTPNHTWKPGDKYRLEFKARADKPTFFTTEAHRSLGGYVYWTFADGNYEVTTEWQTFYYEGTVPEEVGSEGMNTIAFNLNQGVDTDLYFDDFSWSSGRSDFTPQEFTSLYLTYRTTSEETVEIIGHSQISSARFNIPSTATYEGNTYTVTAIGDHAMGGCSSVKRFILPNTIESIGYQAFAYNEMSTFDIPASVKHIGDQVFQGCTKLTTIYVDDGNESFCAVDGVLYNKVKTILYCYPNAKTGDSFVIPSTVTTLATSAFQDCVNLQMVTIPESFRDSGWRPFENGCTKLTTICCLRSAPYYDDWHYGELFGDEVLKRATVYVPKGCLSNYNTKDPWKNFKAIKEMPEQMTVTAMSYSRTYGDEQPALQFTITAGPYTGLPKITCSATKESLPGTYNIVIEKGTLNSPLPLKLSNGKLIINKAALTVTVGNYVKKQGANNPAFTLSYSGFKNNENESVLTKKPTASCSATASSAPGTYPITIGGGSSDSYNFIYGKGTLTVTMADAIVVTARSYTITYGTPIPVLDYTTEGGTLQGKPTLNCSAGTSGSYPNAGTYDITVEKGTVSSYNVSYVKGTLTVKPAPLTISVGNYTKSLYEDMPQFKLTYSGFKRSETKDVLTQQPTVSCEATKYSPAGTYSIKVSGAESPNYDIKHVDGVLTIKNLYSLIITSQGHGKVTYGTTAVTNYQRFDVAEGTAVSLILSPDNGYSLSQLLINGEDKVDDVKNGVYTFASLTADVTVYAIFAENTGSFTVGGITYSILSAPEKTLIVDKSSTKYQGHVVIRDTRTYNAKTWKVVGVADNAFSNCPDLISVTFPQSLQSDKMGESLFTGCMRLAAITWNAGFAMSPTVLGGVNNPNLLFYTSNASFAPSGIENVIVNDKANKITLYDVAGENGNFYCPKEFTATDISYVHNYRMESAYHGVGGWETLALPFTVQKITHERAGDIVPFAAYNGSAAQRPFWLYTYSSSGFVRAGAIEANMPYIICMPNNSEYDAEYLLSGNVTFSAHNATVTSSAIFNLSERPSRGNKTFVAAFKADSRDRSAYVYALNVVNDLHAETGGYQPGSIFIRNLRDVSPFEALMTTDASSRVIDIEFSDVNAIDCLPTDNRGAFSVYNLNGQLLIKNASASELQKHTKQLPAGVYVVNGKKVIIN